MKSQVSSTVIATPLVGSTAPGNAYTSGADITATAGQYLAIYEVDSTGKVVKFYTKQLAASDIAAAATTLNVTVAKGSVSGTTKATATPDSGNTLKLQISSSTIATPLVGSTAPGDPYTSGENITATDGQYLAIYEVDSTGKVVKFYTKQLAASDITPQ